MEKLNLWSHFLKMSNLRFRSTCPVFHRVRNGWSKTRRNPTHQKPEFFPYPQATNVTGPITSRKILQL